MSRKQLLAAAALAAFGLAAAAGGAHASAFQNGSFELGTFVDDGNGADTFVVGATAMPGWSAVNHGDVSWDVDHAFGLTPDDGRHFLDLTGYCDLTCGRDPGFGGVAQTFDTAVGAKYTVTFDLGTDSTYAANGSGVAVTAADYSNSFLNFDAGHTQTTIWQTESFDFVATGKSTTLSFIGNSGQAFIGLDAVTLTQDTPGRGPGLGGVPEPASWALMIIGFGGAGAALRRRRSVLAVA